MPSYSYSWDEETEHYGDPEIIMPVLEPMPGETAETAFEVNADEVVGRVAEASGEESTPEDRHSDSVVGDLD